MNHAVVAGLTFNEVLYTFQQNNATQCIMNKTQNIDITWSFIRIESK